MQYTDEDICFKCKMESRFSGTMRKNLISMLDEFGLQKYLELKSCSELFDREKSILHTTSLIKYPCFYNGKNYSGHTPRIDSVEIFKKYIMEEFLKEINSIPNLKLIIPLGIAVENTLKEIFESKKLNINMFYGNFHILLV